MSVEKALVEQDKLKSHLRALRNSFSCRLGTNLVEAVCNRRRNTILSPFRLTQFCVTEFRRRKQASHEVKQFKFPHQLYGTQRSGRFIIRDTELCRFLLLSLLAVSCVSGTISGTPAPGVFLLKILVFFTVIRQTGESSTIGPAGG